MDEQKETKEEEQENTTDDSTEGSKPKAALTVEAVDAAAERLEAANTKHEELLEREEALAAERKLGGLSEAGQVPPEKKEETPKEYADKVMANDL